MTNTTRMDPNPVISAGQDMTTCPGRHRLDNVREGTPGSYEDGDPVNIRLGVLRIGDVALASVDAEIYSPIGKRLKEQSPMANTVVVTLANGMANSGYIPDDASFGALHLSGTELAFEAALHRDRHRRRTPESDPGE